MIEYIHRVSEGIDLEEEAIRVYRALDKLIPEADNRFVDNGVRGAIYGEFTTSNPAWRGNGAASNGHTFLKVVFHNPHPREISISSSDFTIEQIKATLESLAS